MPDMTKLNGAREIITSWERDAPDSCPRKFRRMAEECMSLARADEHRGCMSAALEAIECASMFRSAADRIEAERAEHWAAFAAALAAEQKATS